MSFILLMFITLFFTFCIMGYKKLEAFLYKKSEEYFIKQNPEFQNAYNKLLKTRVNKKALSKTIQTQKNEIDTLKNQVYSSSKEQSELENTLRKRQEEYNIVNEQYEKSKIEAAVSAFELEQYMQKNNLLENKGFKKEYRVLIKEDL